MAKGELKSAYDLAMERLRDQDRAEGVKDTRPLTDGQKEEIARLRQEAKAKLAELEILHAKRLESEIDPEKLAEHREHYQIDRRRVESHMESEIVRVKKS